MSNEQPTRSLTGRPKAGSSSQLFLSSEEYPLPRRLPRRRFTFPQELVDLIIDHLRDRPSDLRACSCVARAFRSRSQRYLFKFTLWTPSPSRNIRLKTFFEQCPHLCQHIRDLEIILCPLSAEERKLRPLVVYNPGPTVAEANEPLLEISPQLSEVRRLIIKLREKDGLLLKSSWHLASPPDVPSLVDSIIHSARRIEKLCLYGVNYFDPLLIDKCVALKHLELEGSSVGNFRGPRTNSNSPHVITSLTLGNASQSLLSLVACSKGVLDLAHVHNLDIHEEMGPSESLEAFPTSKLENLVIRLKPVPLFYLAENDQDTGAMIPINFDHLPRLVSLSIHSASTYWDGDVMLRNRIVGILEKIPPIVARNLANIAFSYTSTMIDESYTFSPFKADYWDNVDDALFKLDLPPSCVVNIRLDNSVLLKMPATARWKFQTVLPQTRSMSITVRISGTITQGQKIERTDQAGPPTLLPFISYPLEPFESMFRQ